MGFFSNNIRVTHIKIQCAKYLYYLTKIFIRENKKIITRHDLKFEVDLNEGIDFNLYLSGNYQKHIYENRLLNIPEDAVIFDIGANSGVMSLFFSKKVKKGFVYSFEPTHYAFEKLKRNVDLNPELSKRIVLTQCFVSSSSEHEPDLKAYSSWPLTKDDSSHNIHNGVIKSASGVHSITIDEFCKDNRIENVGIIKIDTDGHELDVLKGAKETINKNKPGIIFEVGIYLLEERSISFIDFINFFTDLNYKIFTLKNREISKDNFTKYIPRLGTADIIALPNKK